MSFYHRFYCKLQEMIKANSCRSWLKAKEPLFKVLRNEALITSDYKPNLTGLVLNRLIPTISLMEPLEFILK